MQLLEAAEATGVDVIAIVDHDTVENQNWMGWHRKKFLLAGSEVTLRQEQHIVVFGVRSLPPPRVESASGVFRYFDAEKVFAYIAHPDDPPCPLMKLDAYPFIEWGAVEKYSAIEVWNIVSSAKKYAKNLFQGLRLAHSLPKYIPPPDRNILHRWEDIGKFQKIFGITGLDEHTWHFKKWFWKGELFGLVRSFSLLRLNILVQESAFPAGEEKMEELLIQALREGNFYSSFEPLGPGKNAIFYARVGKQQYAMGQQVPMRDSAKLCFSLPAVCSVKIWRDHHLIAFFTAKEFEFETNQPGMYRPEAYRNGKLWLLFNPIWLISG